MIVFDQEHAQAINKARLEHLQSLRILEKGMNVLDVGCGVGHLTVELAQWELDILACDGRLENVIEFQKRHDIPCVWADVEDARVLELGLFNAVFAYGLLYHCESPLRALRHLTAISPLLVMETVLHNDKHATAQFIQESGDRDQSLYGLAWRLSEKAIIKQVSSLDCHIYKPTEAPDHPEFSGETDRQRGVYVVTWEPIQRDNLRELAV